MYSCSCRQRALLLSRAVDITNKGNSLCEMFSGFMKHLTFIQKTKTSFNILRTYNTSIPRGDDRSSKFLRLWNIRDPVVNPLDGLNQHTEKPVIPEEDMLFRPHQQDVRDSSEIFRNSSRKYPIRVLKGVVDLKDLPASTGPEIAFIGRSNVGKSSLIKSIFCQNPDVKVSISKKPGHTRVLKFYTIGNVFSLVDMPGYGYNMPEYFVESMETYLKTRRQINRVFLLIDGDVGFLSSDVIAMDMLEEFAKPYTIILTKIDKNSPGVVLNNVYALRKRVKAKASSCFPQPFLVSSKHDWGIALLQSYIAYITSVQSFSHI